MKRLFFLAILTLAGCDNVHEPLSQAPSTPQTAAPTPVPQVQVPEPAPEEPETVSVWQVDCYIQSMKIWSGKAFFGDSNDTYDSFRDEATGKRVALFGTSTCVWTYLLDRPVKK